MNQNYTSIYKYILCASLLFSSYAHANNPGEISKDLRSAYEKHIIALDKEDNNAVIQSLHSQSPALFQVTQMMQQMFPVFDMKSEIIEFKYLGLDNEYALARVKQKLVKVNGPMFQDHISNTLFVFKKESGEWKLWQAAALDIQYL